MVACVIMGPRVQLLPLPSHSRVDHLNDGDGRLNMSELGNALGLVRPTEEE